MLEAPSPAALMVALARRHRRILGGAVLGGIGWQLAGIVVPVVVGWTIDRGIVDGDRAAVWTGVAAIVVLGLVEAAFAALRHWNACRAEMAGASDLRLALTDAALRLDEDGAERFPAGEVIARETSDTESVAGLLDAVGHTVAQAISVPVIVVLLVLIDPMLAAAIGVLIPVTLVVMWRYSVVWARHSALAQEAMGRAVDTAQEAVEGFRSLRGIGAEQAAAERFTRRSEQLRDRAVGVGRLWLVFEPALHLLTVLSGAAVLWIGGNRAIDGDLGLGEVVTAVGLVLFLAGPVRTLGERVLTVQEAIASARRVLDVLSAAMHVGVAGDDPRPGAPVDLVATGLTVGRVDEEPVLVAGDLVVEPGELLVLGGPTGSGKSTVLAALAGLRRPLAGTVRLGGIPVEEWPPDALRRRVVLCGPVPFLFAGSVADNVRFADSTASDTALADALAAARCGFVAALDDGPASVLGERGVTLSGGQRQRVALARAVLARPSILLLDGATSALDEPTERAVLAGIRAALPGAALVVVTTNLAVRAGADRVVDLERAWLQQR